METRTINLTYLPGVSNTAGTFSYESNFSWTVTNVIDQGTFVDGTPWIVVGPGAQLIDVTPKSEFKTTTQGSGRYNVSGITMWINGTAKNPVPYAYHDVEGNGIDPELVDRGYAGLTGPEKFVFDGRISLPAALISSSRPEAERLQVYQDYTIEHYDLEANIGIPDPNTGQITPVGLTYGDVIITANCYWYDQNTATPEELNFYGITYSNFIPNAPRNGNRTPIKNFGVLTVLQQSPTEPCFRPPMQWDWDAPQTRPSPIPVSSMITDFSALDHRTPQLPYKSDYFMTSPQYIEGDEYYYQSSSCQWCIAVDVGQNVMFNGSVTYSRDAIVLAYNQVLSDATNLFVSEENRQKARLKLIQYGIDAYGAVMSRIWTSGSAGHRQSIYKPYILLAGWYLNNSDMINIFDSLRTKYSGYTYGTFDNDQLAILNFGEDFTSMPIDADDKLGFFTRQTWTPGSDYQVVNSEDVDVGEYQNYPNAPLSRLFPGKFGKLNVATFNPNEDTEGFKITEKNDGKHHDKRSSYPHSYLKVTSGPGSGDTLYKVIYVHHLLANVPWTKAEVNWAGNYLIVDRPWVNGYPTNESTVELFAVRNGANGVDGSTADIGRYAFVRNRKALPENAYWTDLSPSNDEYAYTSFQAAGLHHCAMWALTRATGLTAFAQGPSHKWMFQRILGTSTNPFTGEKYGNTPDSEIYTNLLFNYDLISGNDSSKKYIWINQQWLGWSPIGVFEDNSHMPGRVDFTRIPGYGLTYDGTSISRVLNNWGKPGGSDFNGDGTTNSLDLAFILDKFGT